MPITTNKTFKMSIAGACVCICLAGIMVYRHSISGSRFVTYTVVKRTLVEDVLASGKVESVTSASFGFKNQGKVTKVAVSSGDVVAVGQELVLQDTTSLDSQLAEMDAGIRLQKARLNQLTAGSSNEEIDVVAASASAASVAVSGAEARLDSSRREALDTLKNAYTVADDVVHNKTDKLFTNPQSEDPKLISSPASDFQLAGSLETSRAFLEKEFKVWGTEMGSLSSNENLSSHLSKTRERLTSVKQFLDRCALFVNNSNNVPSTLMQSSWETLRVDIALGRASINTSLSSVTATEASIKQSESQVASARSAFKTASKQLEQTKATTRGTDLDVYQAQLAQAVAAKRKIETLRSDLVIVAPFSGIITEVAIKKGEITNPAKDVVSMLSYDKLQVKANIVENNIVKVRVGQRTHITFDAMPKKEFFGKVVMIDPAQKEINGTVYYQTTIELEGVVEFLRPGMTANVWVIIQEIQEGLSVPMGALLKRGNEWTLKVITSKGVVEKKVTIGLKESGGMVQIISGVEEGEKIILDEINSYDAQ